MKCASCEAQVPALFGHAIRKNECPACGSALMDEESMALVEELRGFILQTVKVREETADILALALIAAYEISGRDGAAQPFPLTSKRVPAKPQTKVEKAKGVPFEDDAAEAGDGGIVKASDLFDSNNPISAAERDEILQERIETRLIAQNMIPSKVATRVSGGTVMNDRELAESPILEAQRLRRLQTQEAHEAAGLSKIRRSE
jgi:hypothetical protein